jgi:hypothetical protein
MSNEYITLYDVDEYQPNSVKESRNITLYNYLDDITNIQIFLSDKNTYYIIVKVINLNKKNKNPYNLKKLIQRMPKFMYVWANKNKINDMSYINDDIVQTLDFLNNKFLLDHSMLYDRSSSEYVFTNVYKVTDTVTDNCGATSVKKYDKMMASEFHTLNLWNDKTESFTHNAINRYNNKIPYWQTSMNIRHYDKSNGGFHDDIPERSSSESRISGYDMSNIIKGGKIYD